MEKDGESRRTAKAGQEKGDGGISGQPAYLALQDTTKRVEERVTEMGLCGGEDEGENEVDGEGADGMEAVAQRAVCLSLSRSPFGDGRAATEDGVVLPKNSATATIFAAWRPRSPSALTHTTPWVDSTSLPWRL